jgi:hypothetical protein
MHHLASKGHCRLANFRLNHAAQLCSFVVLRRKEVNHFPCKRLGVSSHKSPRVK